MADAAAQRGAAAPRPQQQRARGAERHDRDHGVFRAAPAGRVAVPRDAVPAVPVQAQPRGHERLAELRPGVRGERRLGLAEHRIRQRIRLAVEAVQPRHVDHPVIHLPPLGAPRDRAGQPGEQRVGAADPAWQHVDPRAAAQRGPRRCERPRGGLLPAVQQRCLECKRHGTSLARVAKNQFDPKPSSKRRSRSCSTASLDPTLPASAASPASAHVPNLARASPARSTNPYRAAPGSRSNIGKHPIHPPPAPAYRPIRSLGPEELAAPKG